MSKSHHVSRCDLVPAIWLPDPDVRAEREPAIASIWCRRAEKRDPRTCAMLQLIGQVGNNSTWLSHRTGVVLELRGCFRTSADRLSFGRTVGAAFDFVPVLPLEQEIDLAIDSCRVAHVDGLGVRECP